MKIMRKLLIATILSTLVINAYAKDTFRLVPRISAESNCRMNHKCELTGVFDVEITNDTNEDHTYFYAYEVLADVGSTEQQYASITGSVTIPHYGHFTDHKEVKAKKVFNWAGLHSIAAVVSFQNKASGMTSQIDKKDVEVKY